MIKIALDNKAVKEVQKVIGGGSEGTAYIYLPVVSDSPMGTAEIINSNQIHFFLNGKELEVINEEGPDRTLCWYLKLPMLQDSSIEYDIHVEIDSEVEFGLTHTMELFDLFSSRYDTEPSATIVLNYEIDISFVPSRIYIQNGGGK